VIDPTQELRSLLRQATAGAHLEPALAELLERLLDAALDQAELRGIRMAARTVPHELAQPLSEVRGYAELMLDNSCTPEQQRDCLELILAAAIRAGDLMHAIGRLARPGQPPPQRRRMGGEDLLILDTDA
jgi:signal transduction histidine kinase